MKFRRWKLIEWKQDQIEYRWFLVDQNKEGVDFHGVQFLSGYPENLKRDFNRNGFRADGIELHRKTGDGNPLLNCYVTGGECYADGTTLHAREQLGDIDPDWDDSSVWLVLGGGYQCRF